MPLGRENGEQKVNKFCAEDEEEKEEEKDDCEAESMLSVNHLLGYDYNYKFGIGIVSFLIVDAWQPCPVISGRTGNEFFGWVVDQKPNALQIETSPIPNLGHS